MRIYLNKGHIQFDLYRNGSAEQVIGKMIHADEQGCQIEIESTGEVHAYNWDIIQHICLAA